MAFHAAPVHRILPEIAGADDSATNEKRMRLAHDLIQILNDIPVDELAKVSPQSVWLKNYVKVPMLVLITDSAMQSGLIVLATKVLGELAQSNGISDYKAMTALVVIMLLWAGTMNIHSLNMAMKYYDQLEVIPIYNSLCMLTWFLSGVIVLDEFANYTDKQRIGTFVCLSICAIGIKFLTMKTDYLKTVVLQRNANELLSKAEPLPSES